MRDRSQTRRFAAVATAAAAGGVFVVPFVLLEARHQGLAWRRGSYYAMLFGLLWLLPVVFVLAVTAMWIGLVHDQLPCFLGTPNCD
jgi:hypothetical protein